MGNFTVVLDKTLASQVCLAEWNPDKDLLAIALADGHIAVHRLSWQRLWSVLPDSRATALAWHTDGRLLTVGHADGCVSFRHVETGEVQWQVSSWHAHAVTTLAWTSMLPVEQSKGRQYPDRTGRFLPPIPPPPSPDSLRAAGAAGGGATAGPGGGSFNIPRPSATAGAASTAAAGSGAAAGGQQQGSGALWQLYELVDKRSLSFLCSGDACGCVHVSSFGIVPLLRLDMTSMNTPHVLADQRRVNNNGTPHVSPSPAPPLRPVMKVHLSPDLSLLFVAFASDAAADDSSSGSAGGDGARCAAECRSENPSAAVNGQPLQQAGAAGQQAVAAGQQAVAAERRVAQEVSLTAEEDMDMDTDDDDMDMELEDEVGEAEGEEREEKEEGGGDVGSRGPSSVKEEERRETEESRGGEDKAGAPKEEGESRERHRSQWWATLAVFDTALLRLNVPELHAIARHASALLSLVDSLAALLDAMHGQWDDATRAWRDKEREFGEVLLDHGCKSKLQDELLFLLCCGSGSPAVQQFLATKLTEMSLKRMARSVSSAANAVHALITLHVQPTVQETLFRLAELLALATPPLLRRFAPLGLDPTLLRKAVDTATLAMVKVEQTLLTVAHMAAQYSTVFAWLARCVRRLNGVVSVPGADPESPVDPMVVAEFLTTTAGTSDPLLQQLCNSPPPPPPQQQQQQRRQQQQHGMGAQMRRGGISATLGPKNAVNQSCRDLRRARQMLKLAGLSASSSADEQFLLHTTMRAQLDALVDSVVKALEHTQTTPSADISQRVTSCQLVPLRVNPTEAVGGGRTHGADAESQREVGGRRTAAADAAADLCRTHPISFHSYPIERNTTAATPSSASAPAVRNETYLLIGGRHSSNPPSGRASCGGAPPHRQADRHPRSEGEDTAVGKEDHTATATRAAAREEPHQVAAAAAAAVPDDIRADAAATDAVMVLRLMRRQAGETYSAAIRGGTLTVPRGYAVVDCALYRDTRALVLLQPCGHTSDGSKAPRNPSRLQPRLLLLTLNSLLPSSPTHSNAPACSDSDPDGTGALGDSRSSLQEAVRLLEARPMCGDYDDPEEDGEDERDEGEDEEEDTQRREAESSDGKSDGGLEGQRKIFSSQTLPLHKPLQPLAASVSRGLACVLGAPRRLLLLDLEDGGDE